MKYLNTAILICVLLGGVWVFKISYGRSVKKNLNVYGQKLELCCTSPKTGFYRDGFCQTGVEDYGTHIVCAQVTQEFLEYSKNQGNDLTQAIPNSSFPGLKDGDKWCLCVSRWVEAYEAGVAPRVDLKATEISTLEYVDLKTLENFSIKE